MTHPLAFVAFSLVQSTTTPSVLDLPLDPTRIAIFDARGAVPEWNDALAARNVDARARSASPAHGWFVVPLPAGARSVAEVEELVRDLARDARVQFVSPVFLGDEGRTVIVARDLFVSFVDESARAFVASDETEASFAGFDELTRVRVAARNGFDVLARARELGAAPGVRFADVDLVYTGTFDHVPNDPLFAQCWGLNNTGQAPFGGTPDIDVDAVEAWDVTQGSPTVRIAILDVGVDRAHLDLNVAAGADTTSAGPGDGSAVTPCDNHGTWVAGAAAARIDNGLGAGGTAPLATIVPIRTLISSPACDSSWTTSTTWVLAALGQVTTLGCRVTNCSNGLQEQASVTTAYTSLHTSGVVHFGSAGNGSLSTIHYPARLAVVNGVAAINVVGGHPSWSNTGTGLDLSAPGVSIWTTDRSSTAGIDPGDYTLASGTSLAAPYCAGIAALLLARNPELSASQVDTLLRTTARNLGAAGYDTTFGHGLVRARAALDLAGTGCPTPATFCTSMPSSTGAVAAMSALGSTSREANDLELVCTQAPALVPARYLLGRNATSVPFGNGTRCVDVPFALSSTFVVDTSGAVRWTPDLGNLPGGGEAHPAETWHFQLVYRNVAGGGAGFNTSNGLRVTFCP